MRERNSRSELRYSRRREFSAAGAHVIFGWSQRNTNQQQSLFSNSDGNLPGRRWDNASKGPRMPCCSIGDNHLCRSGEPRIKEPRLKSKAPRPAAPLGVLPIHGPVSLDGGAGVQRVTAHWSCRLATQEGACIHRRASFGNDQSLDVVGSRAIEPLPFCAGLQADFGNAAASLSHESAGRARESSPRRSIGYGSCAGGRLRGDKLVLVGLPEGDRNVSDRVSPCADVNKKAKAAGG